jgi:hypothetical protein
MANPILLRDLSVSRPHATGLGHSVPDLVVLSPLFSIPSPGGWPNRRQECRAKR